ncbi:MaoC family dehydratase [Alcaligenaceae bacterium]|nr:MaoC family dehydratase [Alcaligenaceae bacterium]
MKHTLQEVSMVVTQADIDRYAGLSNDFNPLHVDPAFAATTPMGKPIAHGTLSVNLIWQMLARNFDVGLRAPIQLDIRFLKPLFAGDSATAGGQADPTQAGRYEVWVKGADGTPLISGHAELPGS